MANQQIENDNYAFAEGAASKKPTLICVGKVTTVGDAAVTEKGTYIKVPIELEPVDSGRKGKILLLFRPEWIVRNFKPHILKTQDEKAHFVYQRNIASKEKLSVLRGLSGSKEAFGTLANILLHLEVDVETGGPVIEDVSDALREFFMNNVDDAGQPVLVGYILKQARTKTDETEVGEDGKERPLYVLENRYEVSDFWDVTSKGIKAQIKRAEASNGDIRMTYSGIPF